MKQTIPINTVGGVSKCITCHYSKIGWKEIMSDILPATAMLEIEMEEPKIIQVGNYMDDSGKGFKNPQCGRVYSPDGIAPTLNTCGDGQREPKIMQIGSYSPSSACNAKVLDTDGICPALLDHKGAEPAIVIGSMQANAMRGSVDGVSPCLTEAMGMGGGQIPMIVQRPHGNNPGGVKQGDVAPTITTSAWQDNNYLVMPSILGYTRDDKGGIQNYHEREVAGTIHTSSGSGGNTDQFVRTRYRIRKLTPTECFRLMAVDDSDIDKLKSAKLTQTLKSGKVKEKPMPKTQLYKMAGNSIVVDVLYYIFHQMFIAEPPKPKPIQKSLFDI